MSLGIKSLLSVFTKSQGPGSSKLQWHHSRFLEEKKPNKNNKITTTKHNCMALNQISNQNGFIWDTWKCTDTNTFFVHSHKKIKAQKPSILAGMHSVGEISTQNVFQELSYWVKCQKQNWLHFVMHCSWLLTAASALISGRRLTVGEPPSHKWHHTC